MVKVLDRESITRMSGNSSSGGGGGGGSVDIDLSGYATMNWTEEYYINKEFFSSLFKAYDANGNEVKPNDTATTIDNIKAMFGFWTDFYISALGTGGQQSVGLRLAQLADVNVAGVTNGQVLTYDSTTGKWIASTPQAGTDMATVWANLAAVDNTKQIDGSHLITALNGYATQTWVNSQISDMATKTWVNSQISDMATKTWADGRFLKLSGGTLTGLLNITTNSRTLTLGAQNSSGVHIYNDNNSTTFFNGGISSNGNGSYDIGTSSYKWNVLHTNRVIAYSTTDAAADSANAVALITGNPTGQHLEFDGNEIMSKATGTTNGVLYLNAEGGNCIINETAGNCGIGTGSPSYKLHVVGVAYASTGVYSAGYVTALSDARHKNVISDTGLTVEQIAGAPAIRFTWKGRDDQSVFAGSIAQYWQKILPEVVQSQADDTLSLDYQVAALISSITVARKVVNHESRLQRLERMFAINEDDIED